MQGKSEVGLLQDLDVARVHHYAPLHYLPFISTSRALLSKPSILAAGFKRNHLRSMSSGQDEARGFGSYAFLTLEKSPRILKAKLEGGFPHIGIAVPAETIEASQFSLCRFNVAMTRQLRRGGRPGHQESDSNGRYYNDHQIPIARTENEKSSMLDEHLSRGTMIEVLIHGDLELPDETCVVCYSADDAELARGVLEKTQCPWAVEIDDAPGPYNRNAVHVDAVVKFMDRALANPDWRGDGLEFDRV
jgi:hypothetical protein